MTLKRTTLLMLAGFLAVIALLGLTAYLSWRSNQQEQQVNEQVRDAYDVIVQIERLSNQARDVQTDARSYDITGKAEFIHAFAAARRQIPRQIRQLNQRLPPESRLPLARLSQLIDQRIRVSQRIIDRRRQGPAAPPIETLQTQNRQLLLLMRPLAKTLIDQQQALVDARQHQAQQAYVVTQQRIGLSTVAAVLVVAFILWMLFGQLRRRIRNEAQLAQLERQLQEQLQQQRTQNQALQQLNQQLSQSNENLQQFAYVASHDLQEPLRKIQQFGDLLKANDGNLHNQQLDYLDRMQAAARRMSVLISDLLAFSRVSAQQPGREPVALGTVVEQALDNLWVAVEEAKARVDVDALPTVPGDASQLTQLFQNLLGNALKFHQAGIAPHIHIHAQTVESAELPDAVQLAGPETVYHRVSVSDNGIGFDEKHIDRIFQVFQRLHSRSTFAGTGIGLAICQRVAMNHGGAITAHSQLGKGSDFIIYLPAQ